MTKSLFKARESLCGKGSCSLKEDDKLSCEMHPRCIQALLSPCDALCWRQRCIEGKDSRGPRRSFWPILTGEMLALWEWSTWSFKKTKPKACPIAFPSPTIAKDHYSSPRSSVRHSSRCRAHDVLKASSRDTVQFISLLIGSSHRGPLAVPSNEGQSSGRLWSWGWGM